MIDTHTHIFDTAFETDRAQVVHRAIESGISRMILPAIDSQSHNQLIETVREFPKSCFGAIGLHPTSVNDNPNWRQELDIVRKLLLSEPVKWVAVGEVGLDLYWSRDFFDQQCQALVEQVDLAIEHNMPLIIHTRDAWNEAIEILRPYFGKFRGVFHSFSGDIEHLETLLEYDDIYIGIGGVVTYKKSTLPQIVERCPMERILLETDSPYLPPVPFRGKRNESSYLGLIAQKIAQLKSVTLEQVELTTTENACRLFFFRS